MADLTIASLTGGLNNTDSVTSIPQDQCTVAENVEFVFHKLGCRRNGSTIIDHPNLGEEVTWLHRHLPTVIESDAQLWAAGFSDGVQALIKYKDTAWTVVNPIDDLPFTEDWPYRMNSVTLHGKLFITYKSDVDRMHVWDGTSLRRTGLAEPAAPSVANTGSGTYVVTRYFRVRYTVQVAGVTKRRSEPSDTTTFVPSGSGLSARITKPVSINEDETHWEVEASIDNNLFYRIATVAVGTTTYDDSTDGVTGYAPLSTAVLSEDIGDYDLLHSAEFVVADDDRLILGGSFEDPALGSRITWTPVFNDPGVGNDERSPIDTDNFKDLDTYEGGVLTALSRTVNGYLFAFKFSHIYQLTRSGLRTRAYDSHCLSKVRGAIKGSVVEGLDQTGRPCLYFLDPHVGPCRIGDGGIQTCGMDVFTTWQSVNIDAKVAARAVYYEEKKQVSWWVATEGSETPNLRIMLQTNETRQRDDGIRRGWTTHTGPSSAAIATCLFSNNIDDDTDRSSVLRPFIGLPSGEIWRMDTGSTDNGTSYAAHIVTAPIVAKSIMNQFGVAAATLVAAAASGVTVVINAIKNFGVEESVPLTVSLTPAATEDPVVRHLDNFKLFEMNALQVEFADPDTPLGVWCLDLFVMKPSDGQTS